MANATNQLCCKPSSVFDNHLSSFAVACKIKRLKETRENAHIVSFLASGGVYRAKTVSSFSVVSYTTFPSLPKIWRFISVALSLGSPPQAVSLHHVLWMLGLSSSCDAIVCITDDIIIHNKLDFVKFLQIYS